MNSINPLDIPEIRLMLAEHLDRSDLLCCAQVCKAWHTSFHAALWRDVHVGFRNRVNRVAPPWWALLQEHRKHVQSLEVSGRDVRPFLMEYPKLHTLRLNQDFHVNNEFLEGYSAPSWIIMANPSIARLEVVGVKRYRGPCIWKEAVKLSRLQHWDILDAEISKRDVDAFWKSCINLKTLKLVDSQLAKSETLDEARFAQLQSLHFQKIKGLSGDDQLRKVVMKSPALTNLVMIILSKSHKNAEVLWESLSQSIDSWPDLQSLTLSPGMGDMPLLRILFCIKKPAKHLAFPGGIFGPRCLQAMRPHFATLTGLDLSGCTVASGFFLQEVLCSCPRLESIAGDVVSAMEIMNTGPWVCLQLKKWDIHIKFQPSDQGLQRLVFERLGTLRRLEELDVGTKKGSIQRYPHALDFRFNSGLKALRTLKQMKALGVQDTWQRMSAVEIDWMVTNWPMLKTVKGRLTEYASPQERSLVMQLEQHLINHRTRW